MVNKKERNNNLKEILKPNLDKIAVTIFLFLLTTLIFLVLFHPEKAQLVWLLVLVPSYFISCLIVQYLSYHKLFLRILRWIVFTPLVIIIVLSLVSQFAPDKPP